MKKSFPLFDFGFGWIGLAIGIAKKNPYPPDPISRA